MESITNSDDLMLTIHHLEVVKKEQEILLKEQLKATFDSFKPVSILKKSLGEIVSSSEIKKDLASISIGLITGFVAKKVVVGKTINPLSSLLGSVVEMLVSSETMKHSEGIKSIGNSIFRKLINKNSIETAEE